MCKDCKGLTDATGLLFVSGDIVNQFELNMNFISDLGDWYVPYQDLYNIYFEFYGKELITHADIIECSSLMFAGR